MTFFIDTDPESESDVEESPTYSVDSVSSFTTSFCPLSDASVDCWQLEHEDSRFSQKEVLPRPPQDNRIRSRSSAEQVRSRHSRQSSTGTKMLRRSLDSKGIDFGDMTLLGSSTTEDDVFQAASDPLPLTVSANPKPIIGVETSVGKIEDEDIRNWSAQHVAAWMFNVGFENDIIEKFALHDINGAVLLDLKFEDLRDLDVASYGKRRQLWTEILDLRAEGGYSPNNEKLLADIEKYYTSDTTLSRNSSERRRRSEYQQRPLSMSHGPHQTDCSMEPEPTPQCSTKDELIPRPHRCSKGEKCSKWKQQKSMLEEVDKQHGPNTPPSESSRVFGDFRPISLRPYSSESGGANASNVICVNDDQRSIVELDSRSVYNTPAPSIKELDTDPTPRTQQPANAASADIPRPLSPSLSTGLRPGHPPRGSSLQGLPRLSIPPPPISPLRQASPSGLRSPRTLSPFQKTRSPMSPALPPTISPVMLPSSPTTGFRRRSPSSESPSLKHPSPSFHRLRSPASESELAAPLSPPQQSANSAEPVSAPTRTNHTLRPAASLDSVPKRRDFAPLPTVRESHGTSSPKTPRTKNTKPLLSKPLPVTPPQSTHGSRTSSETHISSSPDPSSTRTTPEPAQSTQDDPRPQAASPCPSDATLVNPFPPPTPTLSRKPSAKLSTTPTSSTSEAPKPCPPLNYGPETIRTGWVRRRRARLWRHEWQPAHVRLTPTRLTLHASARPEDTDPIETIDVDDYAVACSSVSNGSKLAAAMRSVGNIGTLGGKIMVDGGECFVWQLVPATVAGERAPGTGRSSSNGSIPASANPVLNTIEEDPCTGTVGGGGGGCKKGRDALRTYHFAVKTRDERIDWMREVMLAKALRQRQKEQQQKQKTRNQPAEEKQQQQQQQQQQQSPNEKVNVVAKVFEMNGSLSEEGTRARTSLEAHPSEAAVVRCGSF